MAWRIGKSVVRGEIDNRTRGEIKGKIWLAGRKEPVLLDLEGNCLNDLAGLRLEFTNPTPEEGGPVNLTDLQKGKAGDITASRKVREIPPDFDFSTGGKVPRGKLINSLYIEWYSETNGRVVIEMTGFKLTLSDRAWKPLPEEEDDQRASNQEMICSWLDELTEKFDSAEEESEDEFIVPEDRPMDEFEWERFMRESDARAEKFSRLFEQYIDHPDRDRIIAREMGWSWLEDALDTQEQDEGEPLAGAANEIWDDDIPELVPNPLTEGRDWIRNEHGHVEHPLTERAHQLGLDMWRFAEQERFLDEEGDEDVREMVFKAQTTSAKLAGALNHLAYEDDPDAGFIVAALKRALAYLHDSIAAAGRVADKNILPSNKLGSYQGEQFEIRQEIIALMKHYRQTI